ncbi:MAG: WD40 repeat domain-containing protein [Pseudonocardiaceae bacterium]
MRTSSTVLSVLLVLTLTAAVVAAFQQRTAQDQRDIAVSQRVAGQAAALRGINSALAAQLSLAAYLLTPTPEARGSLLSTFITPYSTKLASHTGIVHTAAFSPDGHTLATASADHTVQLWGVSDAHPPRPLSTLTSHTGAVLSVAFSPDGRTLATAARTRPCDCGRSATRFIPRHWIASPPTPSIRWPSAPTDPFWLLPVRTGPYNCGMSPIPTVPTW